MDSKKQLDVSRINSLGWFSKITLLDGLENTIEHLKKNNFKSFNKYFVKRFSNNLILSLS